MVSTIGVTERKIFKTCLLTSRYREKRGEITKASGHLRIAVFIGIADRQPNARASYEAAATTPLLSGAPPTSTARPRKTGWSCCSMDA